MVRRGDLHDHPPGMGAWPHSFLRATCTDSTPHPRTTMKAPQYMYHPEIPHNCHPEPQRRPPALGCEMLYCILDQGYRSRN
jgi:hypothetical protein